MALGNNMRIGKKKKKADSPANGGELSGVVAKNTQPASKEDIKLVQHGNENITCQIEASDVAHNSVASITLGGQLIINYLYKIIDPIRYAVEQHKALKVTLKDVNELDLSCLQLLRAIQITCQSRDMSCVVDGKLSKEQKVLVTNAGFIELFSSQTALNG